MTEEEEKPEKFILFTTPGCPHCATMKEIFKEEIEQGIIEVVDASEGKGAELADKLGIKAVPELFAVIKGELRKCEVKQEGDNIAVYCDLKKDRKEG
ncbi:MAG: hypothetical protein DSO07_01070 [Thermoproteota archaeon]|uniref:Glutaredoxin n=1 Tax=Candidatus Methanodesulfokora washburnensis TaxID=2478471 RepID=A0A3R9RLI9_9CREN|nr:glutaredoxin domain-containing protein [Candidatus Methanodesulfokores washburnensis]RSN72968.1 glutaredoxin [Candidatus Methanodesulfokores washburnensis]TDA42106.1 MAG: hypothetical protein DSO07_01070 [Candidatus Korarchaeota archaeon]